MLKKRLIPKLLIRSKQMGATERNVLVNTLRFGADKYVGTPLSQAKIYDANLADELIFLDIDSRGPSNAEVLKVLRDAAEEIFVPLTFGGGVKTLSDFSVLLKNGADKISINTEAVKNPGFIFEAAKLFGSQCVVVAVDYTNTPDGPRVVIGGAKQKTDMHPIAWALEAERRGAGEILFTAVDLDGTRQGMDINLIAEATAQISIPVIASGGCGNASHFIAGFQKGHADAVAAGTFFSFQDQPPMQTRAHIKNAGIPIRVPTNTPPSY